MTEPDKSDTVDDKRDKGDARSDLWPASAHPAYAPPPTESSDTLEERRPSDKPPEDRSPSSLPEEDYSEGQWLKLDPEDVQRRVLLETSRGSPAADAARSYVPTWVSERLYSIDSQAPQNWDLGSSTTEDRNSGLGMSSEDSRRQSATGLAPTVPPSARTSSPLVIAAAEPTADSQSYHSGTVDSHAPAVDHDEERARRVVLYQPRPLAVYDTDTGASRFVGGSGTTTAEESEGPDYIRGASTEARAPGELADENSPKSVSTTSPSEGLTTLPRLNGYQSAAESRSLQLQPQPSAASSTTKLVPAPPEKADVVGRPLLPKPDWNSTAAALRTRIPRCLLLFNLFVALVLFLLAHLHELHGDLDKQLTTSPGETASYRPDRPVCRGVRCSRAGTHIFYALNRSADPCQSAFDLVCRPWVRQTPANYRRVLLGAERVLVDHALFEMDKLLRSRHLASSDTKTSTAKLALLYHRCMDGNLRDNRGLDHFRDVMKRYELERWPYRDGDVFPGEPGPRLKRFVHETGSDPYFKVRLGKNSSRSLLLAIDCPSLGLPPMSFVNGTADVGRYIDYVKTIIQETSENTADATSVAAHIVQSETDLARLHVTHCGARAEYSQKATDELRADRWNWKEFLSFITEGTIDRDVVLVRSSDYLNGAIAIVEKNDVAGANYVGWKVASRLLPYTTTHMANLTEQFLASTGLQARLTFQQCLAQVNQVLPFAMGRLYVKAIQPTSTSYSAYRVAYYLTKSLDRKVQLERWLGGGIGTSYRHFRAAMGVTQGLPSWTEKDALLDAHYAPVHISDSYLESHMSAARVAFQRTFDPTTSMRGREGLLFPNDAQWTADPSIPPMYDLVDNRLYLLPAALQPPYFVEQMAPALNYGGLGFLLARGLVDELVSLRKGGWPGLEVTAEMREPFQCLVDRLRDRAAASLLGTRLAYLSYQMDRGFGDEPALRGLETTSPDQLFFIAVARTLCGIVRDLDYVSVVSRRSPIGAGNLVDTVLLDLPEYLDAFNCSRERRNNAYDVCFRK